MKKGHIAVGTLLVLAVGFVVVACGSDSSASDDLLASIKDKGTLTVSTDPAYPPQSVLNKDTGKYEGFDIEVATEIAKRLGVEIAWEAPAWETITAGSWNGRWDASVGSMTVTPERAEVLTFSPPYYYTPAAIAVHKDNTTITDATGLSGKKIGVCGGCTYDLPAEQARHREGRDRRGCRDPVSGEGSGYRDERHRRDVAAGPLPRRW